MFIYQTFPLMPCTSNELDHNRALLKAVSKYIIYKYIYRVFGDGLEGIADREKEVLGIRIGHHVGIAPPIYCT